MQDQTQVSTTPAPADEGDLAKFVRGVRDDGIVTTLKYGVHVVIARTHSFLDRNYDREHGVRTSSKAYSWDLTMQSEGDEIGDDEPMYLPSSSIAFHTALAGLPDDLSDFVFVDYGSGMGRTLLLASNYNFKEVIGVEFATELHEIATDNIARYRHADQKCTDLSSKLVDATVWDPPDDPCVFYFFHPFEDVVMDKVLARIRSSYDANPRKMYFAYYKPIYREVLDQTDFVTEMPASALGARRFIPNPYGLAVYETPDRMT